MRCPVSGEEMVIVEVDGVEVDVCIEDHGLWFDADELRLLFEKGGHPQAIRDLEGRLKALPKDKKGARRPCPRCDRRMRHVALPNAEAVVLDACPVGHGLWFDKGELDQILAVELGDDDAALAKVREHLGAFLRPA
jgi:Zn-finger nucleic acid-binding protein